MSLPMLSRMYEVEDCPPVSPVLLEFSMLREDTGNH
jgi:hypothetical protein